MKWSDLHEVIKNATDQQNDEYEDETSFRPKNNPHRNTFSLVAYKCNFRFPHESVWKDDGAALLKTDRPSGRNVLVQNIHLHFNGSSLWSEHDASQLHLLSFVSPPPAVKPFFSGSFLTACFGTATPPPAACQPIGRDTGYPCRGSPWKRRRRWRRCCGVPQRDTIMPSHSKRR